MAAGEKRRVTMTNTVAVPGGVASHVATDYVPVEQLDAYVADAKTRWQLVEVGDEHDGGPGEEAEKAAAVAAEGATA